jgi:hypothetical protein
MLDLESATDIASVKIYNVVTNVPSDKDRLRGAEIRVGNVNSFSYNPACATNLPGDAVITATCAATGRYVFVVQPRSDTCLHFTEIQVFVMGCISCAAGKYSTTEGATAIDTCDDCAAGKFSAAAGAGACDDCAAGKFSTTEGATAVDTCSACTAGKYSAGATGALACIFTPPSPDTCYGAAVMIDLLNARYPFCVHM